MCDIDTKKSNLKKKKKAITAYPWCDGHSTSINVCGVWRARAKFKSPGGRFTHIYT